MGTFTDAFAGTNGDNLEDRTGWTRVDGVAGAAEINASNQLKYSSTTETAYRAPDAGTANHWAQATYQYPENATNTLFFPVCVRLTDKDNFIGFRLVNITTGERQILKRVAGTFTTMFSETLGATTPRIYKLTCSGNDITLSRNGVDVTTVTTTDHNTVTYPGMVCRSQTRDPVIDDWSSLQADALTEKTAADTLTPMTAEAATLLAALARADTLTPMSTEAMALLATLGRTDTLTPSLAEAAAALQGRIVTDTLLLLTAEAATLAVLGETKSATDTLSPLTAEAKTLAATLAVAETLLVVADALAALAAALQRSDSLLIGWAEAGQILAALVRADSLTPSPAETAALSQARVAADALGLSLTELAALLESEAPVVEIARILLTAQSKRLALTAETKRLSLTVDAG